MQRSDDLWGLHSALASIEAEDSGLVQQNELPVPYMSFKQDPYSSYAEVDWFAGEKFLGFSRGSIGAGPALSCSWTRLQRNLTDLTLGLHSGKGNAQLGSLGILSALKILVISRGQHNQGNQHRDLSGEKIVLKLPKLAFLCVCDLQDGELVLSCPSLEMAWFLNCKSFQGTLLENDRLEFLMLQDCKHIRMEWLFPEDNLYSLKSLIVSGCSVSGRHMMWDVGHMDHLERLYYTDFPAACIPPSFPKSLQSITLVPLDWQCDLPKGLKELTNLTELTFGSDHMSRDFTKPLAELLPMDKYVREDSGSKGNFKL